jgi:hypothetical protein
VDERIVRVRNELLCGWLCAGLGGFIGLFGSPQWEMACLFVAPVAALASGFAGTLSAHSGRTWLPAVGLSLVLAGTMALVASQNPAWVIRQCFAAVAVAGVSGTALGAVAGPLFRGAIRAPAPADRRRTPHQHKHSMPPSAK